MTLRFKRNLPLVLALVSLLTLLVFLTGNQPLVSYTVNIEALRAGSFTGMGNNVNTLASFFSIIQP